MLEKEKKERIKWFYLIPITKGPSKKADFPAVTSREFCAFAVIAMLILPNPINVPRLIGVDVPAASDCLGSGGGFVYHFEQTTSDSDGPLDIVRIVDANV